jgi:hypothetical protein
MKRSLLHHLRPARPLLGRFLQQRKGLSSLSFVSNLDSFEDSSNTLLVLNLQSPLKVLKSSSPVRFTLATASAFPPLRLITETQFDLHSPARLEYLKPNSGQKRTRAQLLSLLNALYAEEFNCTRCRNLLA